METKDCFLCAESKHVSKFQTLSCLHRYCWACMKRHVLTKFEEFRIAEDDITCPECKAPINVHELQAILETQPEIFHKLMYFRVRYLHGIKSCPGRYCENQFFVNELEEWVACNQCGH